MASIDSISSNARTTSTTGADAFSTLSSQDFTKLIFAELSKQDPLAPNDTNTLLQQISSIRQVQSSTDLISTLKLLVSQNEFASSASLIGKVVTGLTDDTQRVAGTVAAVTKQDGNSAVVLDTGYTIALDRVDQIIDAGVIAAE